MLWKTLQDTWCDEDELKDLFIMQYLLASSNIQRLRKIIELYLILKNCSHDRRPDLRLFVCLCVGITSSVYELESDSSAHIPLPLEVLPWQKIHGKNNTSCLYFLVEVFIKVSVASLEESSFHAFTSAVNNTNYSSYRVELLSLNNLPTVVKVVCCRQVLRLFVSTGL